VLAVSSSLPNVTVTLNVLSIVFLTMGYRAIRRRDRETHKRWMLAALCSSAGFLMSYISHKILHGDTLYPFHDWTRPVYLLVLAPHVALAILMTPCILVGVWLGLRGRFPTHARLMRWVFPVWMYVSVTGVLVYLMLYVQPMLRS
jgi:putative membrane protein